MEENQTVEEQKQSNKYMRIKKFHFVMGIFLIIFLTAGITTFALMFGEDGEKPIQQVINQRNEFSKLYSAYDTIKKDYYTDIDDAKLISGAITGMLQSLEDPYSVYMDVEEAQGFHEKISSSFEGIGAEIQTQDSKIMIVAPIKGSPAEKAGLKPYDYILSVNGKSLEGMSTTEAVTLIRGKKGTKVQLMVQRGENSEPMQVEIVRDTIPLETVYSKMDENKIATIQITSFSEHTYEELLKAVNDLESKGMKGLVLDLRQNPGGILNQALEISDLFVPEGKQILSVEYRNGEKEVYKAKGGKKIKVPVAVLIDNGSASASEIVAGALKEAAGIPLVGEKTFGKGTVQTAIDLDDGSNIKYTTAKWLTPNENWIHKKGIEPDVKVALPSYANLPYISPEKELTVTSTGTEVKAIEEMLTAVGYKPGKVDGYFDEATQKAVTDFQKANKIEATGKVSGDTTMILMSKIREKIISNDTQLQKAIETVKK
ncbi:S41 family peptidase [Peribacillus alkalitolerans]|uniref:lmo1851 family serine protease n=1 Tax=Peribacillus alkalitolerans TaxID=1550385 RepID=UPI0013D6B5F7|nr:S41 family peptidase [Peribacillus alkalitolerans]